MFTPRRLMLTSSVYSNTLSEQNRQLVTTKARKVLKRAQADSVSLFVQRDTASFTSKMTDNLSKISRVFEFDRDVFSTSVYERAFRGSVKQALKQPRDLNPPVPRPRYNRIHLLGDDESAKDLVVSAIEPNFDDKFKQYWPEYQSEMQNLFVDLVRNILEWRTPGWDTYHVPPLPTYADEAADSSSSLSETLDACANLWWSSSLSLHEPDLDIQQYHGRTIKYKETTTHGNVIVDLDMLFHVYFVPDGTLNIFCCNKAARL
jgi:hypothetical protein